MTAEERKQIEAKIADLQEAIDKNHERMREIAKYDFTSMKNFEISRIVNRNHELNSELKWLVKLLEECGGAIDE